MADYGRTSGTGGVGSSAFRNDDAVTLDDLPDDGTEDAKTYDVKEQTKHLYGAG